MSKTVNKQTISRLAASLRLSASETDEVLRRFDGAKSVEEKQSVYDSLKRRSLHNGFQTK